MDKAVCPVLSKLILRWGQTPRWPSGTRVGALLGGEAGDVGRAGALEEEGVGGEARPGPPQSCPWPPGSFPPVSGRPGEGVNAMANGAAWRARWAQAWAQWGGWPS